MFLTPIWQRLKRFFLKLPKRRKLYRTEGLKYANEIIAAIETFPERGHFVGAGTTQDCETFAARLAERNIQGFRIATLDPQGAARKVSYVNGVNQVNSRKIRILIGNISVFTAGWRSDGAVNSIHCLHDIQDASLERLYLARMKSRYPHLSSLTNFVNGRFQ